MSLLNAKGAALVMSDSEGGGVFVEMAAGAWSRATDTRFPQDEGIVEVVIDSGELFWKDNVSDDPRLTSVDFWTDLESVAAVPLSSAEQVIGSLWVGRRSAFTEKN